jgi:hypothetical protein
MTTQPPRRSSPRTATSTSATTTASSLGIRGSASKSTVRKHQAYGVVETGSGYKRSDPLHFLALFTLLPRETV